MNVSIFEAKTRLSELVRKVQAGEEVVITSGRAKTPVARLEPVQPAKRQLGLLAQPGAVFSESFWEPLPEEDLLLWESGAE